MLITLLFSIYSEHGEGVWNIFHGERIFSFPLHEDENVKGEACKIFLDRASLSAPSPRRGNQPEHSTAWQRTCFGSRGSNPTAPTSLYQGFPVIDRKPLFFVVRHFCGTGIFPCRSILRVQVSAGDTPGFWPQVPHLKPSRALLSMPASCGVPVGWQCRK